MGIFVSPPQFLLFQIRVWGLEKPIFPGEIWDFQGEENKWDYGNLEFSCSWVIQGQNPSVWRIPGGLILWKST